MSSTSQGSYLETEVLTAPPQKLQLMLIEGAIRFAKRAEMHWENGEDDKACDALSRAQQIVTELIGGLNREAQPDLVAKIASVYLFVFRSLLDAGLEHDQQKLDAALRVLDEERQTWRQICEQIGTSREPPNQATALPPSGPSSGSHATPIPDFSPGAGSVDTTTSGLSLEA